MMKRVFIISICIVTALMVLAGCAAAKDEGIPGKVFVYYPDENYGGLSPVERTLLSSTTEGKADELIKGLYTEPLIDHLIPVLNDDVYNNDSQSVVPGPAALGSFENLLEIQFSGPTPDLLSQQLWEQISALPLSS